MKYRYLIVLEDYSGLGTNDEALAKTHSSEYDDMVYDCVEGRWLHEKEPVKEATPRADEEEDIEGLGDEE